MTLWDAERPSQVRPWPIACRIPTALRRRNGDVCRERPGVISPCSSSMRLYALLLLVPCDAAVPTTAIAPLKTLAVYPLRSPIVVMGRAEKRAAAKRAKKGGGGGGGRSASATASRDRMSRDTVLTKLREVPVFGLQVSVSENGEPSYATADDGCSSFFLDAREAELACAKLGKGAQVNGITLDKVFFVSWPFSIRCASLSIHRN